MSKLLIIIFSVLLFASCNQFTDSKTLYIAHTLNQKHPVHQGIVAFQEALDSISNGKLKLKIFPDGQLGSEREVLELLQIGSIAMTKVSAAAMSNFAPEYKVLGVPYLFRDKKHMFDVLEGDIGKELMESSSAYLLKGVCFYNAGSRSFYTTKKPIKTPADLKGQKIRVMNHQMSVDMVNTMGGSATPMSYGELYTALQQGVVDGAENNPPSFVSSNHYEVAKNYTIDEHSSIPDVVVISTKYWDSLTKTEQEWLTNASKISVKAQKKYWDDSVEKCMKILKDANVNIIRPDKSIFSASVSSLVENFTKDKKMKDLVAKIKAK
ncbi:MAG: TRAP transporter substrate-binding protein [Saprospiraceae bacterium]